MVEGVAVPSPLIRKAPPLIRKTAFGRRLPFARVSLKRSPQDDNLLQRYAAASIVRQFGDPNLDGHECNWPGIRCGMDNTIIKLRKSKFF